MNRQLILSTAGGVAMFTAVVAVGAFAIVSVSPPERPPPVARGTLLMEAAPAPQRLDEPPKSAPAPLEPLLPPLAEPPRVDAEASPPARAADPVAPGPAAAPEPRRPPRAVAALPPGVGPAAPGPLATHPPAAAPIPAPAPALRPAPRPERRADGVLTAAEIRRFRLGLRLTREQEPYWPAVEQALLDLGAQQAALIRAGQDPKDAFGIGAAMRMQAAARPLLDVLREDQKARVREQARAMGFGAIASAI